MKIKHTRTGWLLGLLGGAAAVGGGLYWYEKMRGVTVTASSGTMNVTVPSGQTLTVNLPSGQSWVGTLSFSGTGNLTGGTGTSPLVISNVTSGGTVALAWTGGAATLTVSTS